MNEKEYFVKNAETLVKDCESKVREAKINLDNGTKQAKLEMEKEINRLKFEYERSCIALEKERNYLARTISDLERGFDVN